MLKRLLLASSAVIALSVAFAPSAMATFNQNSPRSNFEYFGAVSVSWSSSTPMSSVSLVWTLTAGPYYNLNPGGQTIVNLAVSGSASNGSFNFSPGSPTSSPSIASVTGIPLEDGTYSVFLRGVQASTGTTIVSATATNVLVDFYTAPPTLTSPAAGGVGNTLPVSLQLPQPPALTTGAVQLTLTNQSTNAVTTLNLPNTSQSQSFTLTPGNLGTGSPATVASGPSSLTDGAYSVAVSYANEYGDPAASSTPITWTLETRTQTPQAPSVTGGAAGSLVQVSYNLPEAATPGTAQLVFTGATTTTTVALNDQTAGSHSLTLDPSNLASSSDVTSVSPAGATLPDGEYSVALTYQDALGNPFATSAGSALTVSPAPALGLTPAPTPTTTTPSPTTTSSAPTTGASTPTTAARDSLCHAPSGRLEGHSLGPLALGMTRATARAMLPRYVVTVKGFDRFCLRGGHAVRVAYASPRLLAWVPSAQRALLRGRIVLALTSNPFYALHSITPGATLTAARAALHLSPPLRIGLNTWYFVPEAKVDGVLKVRDGHVQEIGIATRTIAAAGTRNRTMRNLWTTTPR